MNREAGTYRKYAVIGPGGWKCSCCAPAPGKPRKRFLKWVKRTERMQWKQHLLHEIAE